nr:PilT/PilU family type 4a pilus ATPase [Acidovorax temperans]
MPIPVCSPAGRHVSKGNPVPQGDARVGDARVEIFSFLNLMVEKAGSYLFFSVGAPVNLKIEGITHPLKMPALRPEQVKQLAYSVMNERQISEFAAKMEMNLSISAENLGRFRVNVFVQRGETGMVIRYIKNKIPPLAALGLPPVLEKLVMRKRGLVLVTGATGSGKSTTLASMLNYRNENATGHILTIEDPLEFLHAHKLSVVDQREVGIDTHSYEEALKNALREAPDVIMIGEIRDRNTMKQAIAYAETGHLCLSTLHANNANQAMERVINFFPEEAHRQLLVDLSLNLAGVVSQRLIPGLHEKLVPAVEVMLNSSYISDLIAKGEFSGIKEAMARSTEIGMCTFDQALYQLYTEDRISLDEALHNADSRTDLALRIRLAAGVSTQDAGDLSIDTSSPIQSAARLA